ncbi:MAG TPA: translation initiation factor IF-2 [Candidatus Paceibacterota bacterium]|nr:translation initiation factor IF-2 [Candidatus Paceibacterota bacterium]
MNSTAAHNTGAAVSRPPIVVVLGHVDHGKTTLLDAIRKTNVVGGESGGITQHIGAYQVVARDRLITFLDTPGHEAFTAIRSRGAKVADVAILVVAADESVKPQTVEAIHIIKEANLPMVVAINKSDKPGANVQKVKQDLAQHEVLVEDWGGQVPAVQTAAKQGTGVQELLDMVLLVADLAELKTVPDVSAKGVIIESHKDPRRGFVATVLVREGVLKVGDWVVAGHVVGKLKSMEDFTGAPVSEAGPSMPVAVTGWLEAPPVGAALVTAPAKKAAEDIAADSVLPPPPAFETFRTTTESEEEKVVLNVIFKADVSSSLEALERAVATISREQITLRVLDSGIGNVSEADVKTAAAKGAVIFGFSIGIDPAAAKLAERDSITIRTSDIIYEVVEAVRKDMERLLPSRTERTVVGKLRVLAIFKKDARSIILGGKVTTGVVKKGSLVDLVKEPEPVRVGKITSLQQEKQDVAEVATGVECGMRIDTSTFTGDIGEGDVLEFVTEAEVAQTL